MSDLERAVQEHHEALPYALRRQRRRVYMPAIACLMVAFVPELGAVSNNLLEEAMIYWGWHVSIPGMVLLMEYIVAPLLCIGLSWVTGIHIRRNREVYTGLIFLYAAMTVSVIHCLLVMALVWLLRGFHGPS